VPSEFGAPIGELHVPFLINGLWIGGSVQLLLFVRLCPDPGEYRRAARPLRRHRGAERS